MGDGGYSQSYMPMYSYRNNSYRNGGNQSYRGNGYGMNSYNGRYSRTGNTMHELQRLMDEAQTEQEREAIRRAMESM